MLRRVGAALPSRNWSTSGRARQTSLPAPEVRGALVPGRSVLPILGELRTRPQKQRAFMVTRRKRLSALGKLPGALSLLQRRTERLVGSRTMLGAVFATLFDQALAEPGSIRLEIVIFMGP